MGGSGGLGEAMAHTLSDAGAGIALVGRNQAKLDKVAGDLKERKGSWLAKAATRMAMAVERDWRKWRRAR